MAKASCLDSRRSRVRTSLCHSGFIEKKNSPLLICKDSILSGASVTERYRARPQAATRAVSFRLSHHLQEVVLAQFSLGVHNVV